MRSLTTILLFSCMGIGLGQQPPIDDAGLPWDDVQSVFDPDSLDFGVDPLTGELLPSPSFDDMIEDLLGELIIDPFIEPYIQDEIQDILDDWEEQIRNPVIQVVGGGGGVLIIVPFHDEIISEIEDGLDGLNPFGDGPDISSIPLPQIDIPGIFNGTGTLDIDILLNDGNHVDGLGLNIDFVF